MGKREDKINREIRKEQAKITRLKKQIRELKRLHDECVANELTSMAEQYEDEIKFAKEDIEKEKARISGKREVLDKPGVSVETLIEKEEVELDKKRSRRDKLLAKKKLTPAEKKELESLRKEIFKEGNKIKGKEIAGKAAGEYAMVPLEPSGKYKVAVYAPGGQEIISFLLPTSTIDSSFESETVTEEDMLEQLREDYRIANRREESGTE